MKAHYSLKLEIDKDRIESVLTSGLEGGIQYWGSIKTQSKGNVADKLKVRWFYEYAIVRGAFLMIEDREELGRLLRLDHAGVAKAIKLLPKHPKLLADILSDNTDAESGDQFIQLALFGEVIYG